MVGHEIEGVLAFVTSAAVHPIAGRYGQDYVFAFEFPPAESAAGLGDDLVVRVDEVVDSLWSAKFFAKLAAQRRTTGSSSSKL